MLVLHFSRFWGLHLKKTCIENTTLEVIQWQVSLVSNPSCIRKRTTWWSIGTCCKGRRWMDGNGRARYCWCFRNPVNSPVDMVNFPLFTWFYTSQVVGLGISEPSTVVFSPLNGCQDVFSKWWNFKYFLSSPRNLGKWSPIWRAYFSD